MDKKGVFAILICLGIFYVWFSFVAPWIWPPPTPQPVRPKPAVASAPSPQTGPVTTPPGPEAPKAMQYPDEPAVTLRSKNLEVVFTNRGGGILRAALLYPEGQGKRVPMLETREERRPHFALQALGVPIALAEVNWKVAKHVPDTSVSFVYPLPGGVEITKEFSFEGDHQVRMTLWLKNTSPKGPDGTVPEQKIQLELFALNGLEHDSSMHKDKQYFHKYEQYFKGVVRYESNNLVWDFARVEKYETALADALRMSAGKDRDEAVLAAEKELSSSGGHKKWFGLRNRFFAAVVAPDKRALDSLQSFWFRAASKEARRASGDLKNLDAIARTDEIRVGAQEVSLSLNTYLGPIHADTLKEVPEAGTLLDHGGGCAPVAPVVRHVGPLILAILNFFGGLFGNYGFAIIVTTIVIRCFVFPLSLKGQKSAFRMQELGPKITALRDRYKDDQQKFGTEQMKLFKEHKINPLSGCFPLFLQLPVFVGMFSVFDLSIELRGEPFVIWITNLAEPDMLLGPWKPISIWLLFGTLVIESLNLLPILMMITWFLQAYFAPRSPDPQMRTQQKMMMAMPLVFGLACYGYASGLSLYFFVNSLLAMGEQKLIKKYFLKPRSSGQKSGP